MIEQIEIRQETKDEFAEVFELNQIAFGRGDEAKLVDALRNNPNVFVPELSLVAVLDNKIVGHILFTKISVKADNGNMNESLALAPMAVIPELQQCGIGGRLVGKGLEVAKKMGFKSAIVLGHEHYYPKFGFEPAERWNIKAPFDAPANVFMGIELVNDGLKNIIGIVIYPKEFEMV